MKILRELRERRGLTLEQVAEALGSKNQYISNYELGKRRPDYDTLARFADFYGVSVDYLLGRVGMENASTREGGRISEGDMKLALFGGGGQVTDEMWNEALFAVELIKKRHEKGKK